MNYHHYITLEVVKPTSIEITDDNLHTISAFISEIKSKSKKQNVALDIVLIETTIDYITHYHRKQIRHSGEPYFYHLLEVAKITADYLLDNDSIIAALLHDVVEDTESFLEQIELIFGKKVAKIVDAVSKITCDYQLSKEEVFYKITNFLDIERIATTIKVIDRLHNMRTIHYIKSIEKQKRIARETLQFYIPLAKSIGLLEIARELKNITVQVLNQNP